MPVTYQIGAGYVGQTSRTFDKRFREHQRNWKTCGAVVTAVMDAKVIDVTRVDNPREAEVKLITSAKPALNVQHNIRNAGVSTVSNNAPTHTVSARINERYVDSAITETRDRVEVTQRMLNAMQHNIESLEKYKDKINEFKAWLLAPGDFIRVELPEEFEMLRCADATFACGTQHTEIFSRIFADGKVSVFPQVKKFLRMHPDAELRNKPDAKVCIHE